MNSKRQKISESKNEKLPLTGNLYKKNQRRISFFKLFRLAFISVAFLSITFLIVYAVFLNNKTSAESINQNTVLNQLSKNLILPNEEVVEMRRVSDARILSEQEAFYDNVKNGDYIIVYKSMSILYDFDKSLIKKIKTY